MKKILFAVGLLFGLDICSQELPTNKEKEVKKDSFFSACKKTKDNSMLNSSNQGLHAHNWLQAANELEANGETYALVTVLGTSGSTPRASGTKMVISENDIYATIGGGHLEFKAIEHARELLKQGQTCQAVENFQLGASLGQCCGGFFQQRSFTGKEKLLAICAKAKE